MKKPTRTLFLLTLLLGLLASGSTHASPSAMKMDKALAEISGQDGTACLRIRDISGYTALSESVVSARMLRGAQALLTTNRRCPELQATNAAIFDSTVTQICGGRTDSLITLHERCTVKSIFEFEDDKAASEAFRQAEGKVRSE